MAKAFATNSHDTWRETTPTGDCGSRVHTRVHASTTYLVISINTGFLSFVKLLEHGWNTSKLTSSAFEP